MSSNTDPDRTISRATVRKALSSSSDAIVRAVYPKHLDWIYPVGHERVVIGRVPANPVPPLVHETVSRSHLAIDWDGIANAHVATDMGSHNGTRVNGSVASAGRTLSDGSVLQLGDVILIYECGRGVSAPLVPEVSRDNIPGESASMRLVRAAVARAAPDPSPVLLVGETGTGKEWIASEIHRLSGRDKPMLAINCSALSPQIIDSQLFGHVRGAFTGASSDHDGLFRAANGGTLLLDEIGELPLELQPKLLRVLQEGKVQPVGSTKTVAVDVRVVAATNRDLSSSVTACEFRRDLYARLALWEIRVPPLRQRRGDVLGWIERLHKGWVAKRGQQLVDGSAHALNFLPDVAERLILHSWPDNLRGIDRLIHELSSTRSHSRPIGRDDLPPWLFSSKDGTSKSGSKQVPVASPAKRSRKPVPSREEFEKVFDELDGNVRAMAKHFARDRRQIYRWLDAYGLSDKRKNKK